MRAVGSALRGLTLRGRAFAALGVAVGAAGVTVGAEDLLRVGVFLLVLPLVSVAVVSRTRYRLACERRLVPARVPAGTAATVVLSLDNVSRLPSGVLLMEDALPYHLGGRPRFVLDKVEPKGRREVGYPAHSDTRGRFRIGPLSVRLTDPFGMCELVRSFASVDTLTVTPVVVPLPAVRLGGDRAGGGDSTARSVASTGEDDAATREYRQGDDLRRVHWRSTARTGELMVRREEQPWQSRATILLDGRVRAHGGEGPQSSYEWAVSAVASITVHLARGQYALQVLDERGANLGSGAGVLVEQMVLDALAVTEPTAGRNLVSAASALRRHDGLLVAVLGDLTADDAERLARLRHGSGTGIAVLLDVADFAGFGPRLAAEFRGRLQAATRLLTLAGWRVLTASRGSDLSELWPAAGTRTAVPRPSPAPLSPVKAAS